MRRPSILFLAALSWVAVAHSQNLQSVAAPIVNGAPAAAPAKTAAVPDAYEIGEGDLVAIHVWKEPDLTRVLPVRPDGNISMPIIGEVKASGKTASQLQASIVEELRRSMENPEVAVMVTETRSKRFNVVGQVQRPGSFSLTQPTTVLDAIAMVGGFRDFARVTQIYVLRIGPNGTSERVPFNYKEVIKGRNVAQNVQLEPKDTVVVP